METVLKTKYEQYKIENPKVRIRDAAKALSVSEADLVATNSNNIRLKPDCEAILKEIASLGYVMALTRNDYAVHERKGSYTKASFSDHIGLVVNPDIDLRLFMANWAYAFAVNENDRLSLQFFDKWGTAIHKIYLTDQSNLEAYHAIVEKYKSTDPDGLNIMKEKPALAIDKNDNEIDVVGLQKEWLELQDTHHFFGILKRYGVSRRQSMRVAPEGYTIEIEKVKIESLLQDIAAKGVEFMVFIGNGCCLQIHTGKAENIVRTGPWLNILDSEFNMHLRDDAIESVWIVKKPTNLGLVHSIEAYDQAGNLIVQFFGKRKPNIPEREDWREVIQQITPLS